MKLKWILFIAASTGIFSSCKKDGNSGPVVDPVEDNGKVVVKFENYAGNDPLQLNTGTYTNAHGDQFTVSLYKYYISNVKLVKDDGSEFAEAESYHLINQADAARLSFTVNGVPPGTYTKIKVLLGVDSLRNVSGAQSGDLDPMLGMFWNWNSGYIMAKVEGTSPQATGSGQLISFHLGGFSGFFSVLQQVELALPQPLVVTTSSNPSVTIKSDILKWFDAPNMIDFSQLNQVGSHGKDAWQISVNYSQMLSVTKVDN